MSYLRSFPLLRCSDSSPCGGFYSRCFAPVSPPPYRSLLYPFVLLSFLLYLVPSALFLPFGVLCEVFAVSSWLPLLVPFALLLIWVLRGLLFFFFPLDFVSVAHLCSSLGCPAVLPLVSRRLSAFVSLSHGNYAYGNSRLAPSCRLFIFSLRPSPVFAAAFSFFLLIFHYSPSGCGSLSICLAAVLSLSLSRPSSV